MANNSYDDIKEIAKHLSLEKVLEQKDKLQAQKVQLTENLKNAQPYEKYMIDKTLASIQERSLFLIRVLHEINVNTFESSRQAQKEEYDKNLKEEIESFKNMSIEQLKLKLKEIQIESSLAKLEPLNDVKTDYLKNKIESCEAIIAQKEEANKKNIVEHVSRRVADGVEDVVDRMRGGIGSFLV